MLLGVKARVAIELGFLAISAAVLTVGSGWEKERAAGLACYRHNAAQQQLVEDTGIQAGEGPFLLRDI